MKLVYSEATEAFIRKWAMENADRIDPGTVLDVLEAIGDVPAAENAETVVRCCGCEHCYELKECDPMEPYHGENKDGFFCAMFGMVFYAPHYSAEKYYCADGKARGK